MLTFVVCVNQLVSSFEQESLISVMTELLVKLCDVVELFKRKLESEKQDCL